MIKLCVRFAKTVFLIGAMSMLTACGGQGDSVDVRVADARKRNDGPAIWKVSDNDSVLFLYGTVHMLPEDTHWQRRDFKDAFSSVGTIFFEIPGDTQAAFDISRLQRQHGVYDNGQRLSQHLDGYSHKRLMAAAYNVDIPPEGLEPFKPWLVTDMLMVAAAQKAGLSAEFSVDTALRAKATASQKRVLFLEPVGAYIEAVAGLPDWVQMQALEDTVEHFDTAADDFKKVNAAWLVGNADYLTDNLIVPSKEKSAEQYQVLFVDRNIKWAGVLDEFLRGDDRGMAVVGIGHLLGPDSLQYHLSERGYDVERVRRFDLPN